MRSSKSGLFRFLLRIALFAAIMIVAGELFLRFVVPAGNTAFRLHDPEFGILVYDTSAVRQGIFTSGRLAQQRSRWHINNWGWKAGWDFQPPSPARKPVIALIGDSYIAGFHVDDKEHISAVLQNRLGGKYNVYTFGEGGAPLSEFVWMARYAARHFDPDVFVFLVGDNDWTSSLTNYKRDPRVHQVTYKDDSFVDAPFTYNDKPQGQLPKHSAIVRYLAFNADLDLLGGLHRQPPKLDAAPTEQAAAKSEKERILNLEAEYFVNKLLQDHPGKQIVFLVDARRRLLYVNRPDYPQETVARLAPVCSQPNVHMLNMAPILAAHWSAEHRRFNFKHDDHWNAYGHQVFGEALADFLVRERIISNGAPDSSVVQMEASH